MVSRTGSSRKKSKLIMRVAKRDKGKLSLSRHLQNIKAGDRVVFKATPSSHKGQYFIRFHGKTGQVLRQRGGAYEVELADRGKKKIIIVKPAHLVKVKNGTKNN